MYKKIKRQTKKVCLFFLVLHLKLFFIIVVISSILLYLTFTFEEVPPILNRGIQPATFPKALLILIIVLSLVVYSLSIKNPWQIDKNLPSAFYITLASFIIFSVVGVSLDFFLGISILSVLVSYFWGERRIFYLFLVAIIFPIIVFIFFETILGLRFPGGIITNLYYN